MRFRSDDFSTMEVYMDVYDTPLGRKWLTALNDILNQNLILEKNYCFMGFIFGQRDGEVILNEINYIDRRMKRIKKNEEETSKLLNKRKVLTNKLKTKK